MKKIALTLTIVSVISMFANSVFATDIKDYWEFHIPNDSTQMKMTIQSANPVVDVNTAIADSAKKFNNDKNNFTDEKRNKALKVLESLQKANVITSSTQTTGVIKAAAIDYDANKAKLRAANFIEGILNVQEGMSLTEIYKLGVTHANAARDAALKEFPKTDYTNVMLRDSFRHFSWNNMATKDIGNLKTRTGTINHEWGIKMLDPMTRYFDSQYNTYKSKYSDAGNRALADTINYIPTFKYYMVSLCKGSYSFFKSFFDISNIMDLHNNCWGRAYAGNYPSYTYKTAYYTAKGKSELILAENIVSDGNFKYVWQSQWYTY